MVRLYIILVMILLGFMMWIENSNASLLPIKDKSKVTNAMVNEKMMPYIDCMNTQLIITKEAFNNTLLKDETASANTMRIVKGCDAHLRHVLKWLFRMGELNSKIENWAYNMRQQYLDEVFEYLTTGIIVRGREHRDGNSPRKNY